MREPATATAVATAVAIARCRTELANAHEAVHTTTLDAPALRGAVHELAGLVEQLAGLADELAARARTGLCAGTGTIGDITTDLRTTARHLATAKLLLEPAIDDLDDLAGAPVKVPA
jgi:hypothetical protein